MMKKIILFCVFFSLVGCASKSTNTNPNATPTAEFLRSASKGDKAEVEKILNSKEVDVNQANRDGMTALMVSAFKGRLEMMRYLIDHGADVDRVDRSLATAVHHAVHANQAEAVQLLLEKGADPNAPNGFGLTPLMIACRLSSPQTIRALLDHKASLEERASDGWQPLQFALARKDPEVIAMVEAEIAKRSSKDVPRKPNALGIQEQCFQEKIDEHTAGWCVYRDPNSRNRTVLYSLHGNGESERSWADNSKDIYTAWKNQNQQAPIVVTVSFGPTWYLNSAPNFFAKSLHQTLFQALIPKIESKLGFAVDKRVLMGKSMGGFNASQLTLKNNPHFDRTALLCPAIIPFSPFKPQEEALHLKKNPETSPEVMDDWLKRIRKNFPSSEVWKSHDPLQLVKNLNSNSGPFFILGDESDPYGFFAGAQDFAAALTKRGIEVRTAWIPNGGHCQFSPNSIESLAKFLVE